MWGNRFGDKMWIHNCYNDSLCMRSYGYQDKNIHFPKADLTDEECMELKRYRNVKKHLNLLEPDSVMKYDKAYNFAMIPPYECEEVL